MNALPQFVRETGDPELIEGAFKMEGREYRSKPGFNFSLLKRGDPELKTDGARGHLSRVLGRIQAEAHHAETGQWPVGYEPKKSKARSIGSLYHTLLLEPEMFGSQYALVDDELKAELVAISRERKLAKAPQTYSGQLKEAKAFIAETGRKPDEDEQAQILAAAQARYLDGCDWHPMLTEFGEWCDMQAAAGKTVVYESDLATDRAMVDALFTLPQNAEVASYMESCRAELTPDRCEVSLFAAVEFSNLPGLSAQVKGRPDFIPFGNEFIDPKTTQSAHNWDFAKSVSAYGYDMQAGFYLLLSEWLADHPSAGPAGLDLRFPKTRFGFLAQETCPPFLAKIWWLPDDWIRWGRRRALNMIRKSRLAWESGNWCDEGGEYSFTAKPDRDTPGEVLEPPPHLMRILETL